MTQGTFKSSRAIVGAGSTIAVLIAIITVGTYLERNAATESTGTETAMPDDAVMDASTGGAEDMAAGDMSDEMASEEMASDEMASDDATEEIAEEEMVSTTMVDTTPDTAPETTVDTAAAATPDAMGATDDMATDATDTTEDTAAMDDALPEAPHFDQVRVAPDGATVIAGRAPDADSITVMLDGEAVSVTDVNPDGDFAVVLSLPGSDMPRMLTLMAELPDGTERPGAEAVIVAPFGMVAEADAPAMDGDTTTEMAAADTDAGDMPPGTPEVSAPAVTDSVAGAAEADPATGALAGTAATDADPGAAAPATPPATVIASGEGIAITQPEDRPAAQTDVEIAAVEIDEAGEMQISGTAPAGSELEISVDDGPAQLVEVPETGEWSVALPDVAPGSHDLEITERDAEGTEVASATSTIERTDPDAPATAMAEADTTAPAESAPATPPAVIIAGADGVRVSQSAAAPVAQTEIRIDAISYDTEGDVILSGRGPAEAQLEVTLDNRPVRMGEVAVSGNWTLDLPDVDPGTYTLRVTEVAPDGETVASVETPFLREDPARVAAAAAPAEEAGTDAPQNAVEVVTVQPGFTLWGIAERAFGEGIAYVQIFEENREQIRDPDWIFPGQIFRIPAAEAETASQ